MSTVPILWGVWFAIGAFVGSFLNVCIWRMPRNESVVRPRSRCPACSHPIAWYDNIPILSYLLLRGRCRHCRGVIHWRYPLVEILGGIAAVAVLQRFGTGLMGIIYLMFVWALIAVSFIDLEHQIIPDEISLGGLVLGLLISPLVPHLHGTDHALTALWRSLIGALTGAGLLYVTGTLGSLVFRKEAMGGGDVKLLGMAGSLLGWKLVTLTFFLAPFIAIGPGILVLLFRRSHVIPYGPFLSLALVLSVFAGQRIMQMTGVEETMSTLWSYHGWRM